MSSLIIWLWALGHQWQCQILQILQWNRDCQQNQKLLCTNKPLCSDSLNIHKNFVAVLRTLSILLHPCAWLQVWMCSFSLCPGAHPPSQQELVVLFHPAFMWSSNAWVGVEPKSSQADGYHVSNGEVGSSVLVSEVCKMEQWFLYTWLQYHIALKNKKDAVNIQPIL